MKICPKCNVSKLLDGFHKNRKERDGLQSWCKVCRSAHAKMTHDTEKWRIYRINNSEKIREIKQAHLVKNRIKERNRIKKWEKANPEKANAIKIRHSKKHGERDIKRLLKFVADHPQRKNMGRKELREKYVCSVLVRRSGINKKDIPKGLINAKREQLRILRELKLIKEAA